MKTYYTDCDMGNIKIFNKDMSCFFMNGFGDSTTKVRIYDKPRPKHKSNLEGEFLGHFTVKTKAYLSAYDCNDESIHNFNKGRYFVYRMKELDLVIEKIDEDIHA